MEFSVPGHPEDYYKKEVNSDGSEKYSAVRPAIRSLVELRSKKTQEVIAGGGDAYTASLDMLDIINDFISHSPVDAQVAFYEVLTQETDAATASLNDKTAAIYEETAKKEASNLAIGQWIGGGILFVVIMLFLLNM